MLPSKRHEVGYKTVWDSWTPCYTTELMRLCGLGWYRREGDLSCFMARALAWTFCAWLWVFPVDFDTDICHAEIEVQDPFAMRKP